MISRGHRRELNRALHELRRPLQALALAEDGGVVPAASPSGAARRGLIELARSAAAELERIVNGGVAAPAPTRISCRELVLASLERWRPTAARAGGIKVFWDAGPALVEADAIALAQALDNLLANALEHGDPPLVVTGARVAGRVRVTIANGCADAAQEAFAINGNGNGPRPEARRGHGLEIVSRVASGHGGRFALCRTGSGCVAALELPLAEAGLARAA